MGVVAVRVVRGVGVRGVGVRGVAVRAVSVRGMGMEGRRRRRERGRRRRRDAGQIRPDGKGVVGAPLKRAPLVTKLQAVRTTELYSLPVGGRLDGVIHPVPIPYHAAIVVIVFNEAPAGAVLLAALRRDGAFVKRSGERVGDAAVADIP